MYIIDELIDVWEGGDREAVAREVRKWNKYKYTRFCHRFAMRFGPTAPEGEKP